MISIMAKTCPFVEDSLVKTVYNVCLAAPLRGRDNEHAAREEELEFLRTSQARLSAQVDKSCRQAQGDIARRKNELSA